MPTPTCVNATFTKRALRFFHEPEIFIGIAVGDPWTDENAPPTPVIADRGMGRITQPAHTGTTLTTSNTKVEFNLTCFKAGIESYRIVCITDSSHYNVYKVSDNSLIGGPYAAQAAGRKDIVAGLTFTVTSTSMTVGHDITYKVDGPIGFKKCEVVKLVVQDDAGEIDYYNGNYREVLEADAYDQNVRHVYVQAVCRYAELPLVDYRQEAVLTGLVREGSVSGSKTNLLPSEVLTSGAAELILDLAPTTRTAPTKQYLGYILEF